MTPILIKENTCVQVNGKTTHLTKHEFNILSFLMTHPHQYYTADEIYANSWDELPFKTQQLISVHIRHIREKIERNPSQPEYIISMHGKGYQFMI